jgi:O-antigen/teichoic acid export membrane protein
MIFAFKLSFKRINIRFSIHNSIQTYPFFLIGFSGWLSSKADIYVVSYFFKKIVLSEYQVFISFFLILQAIPSYIIMPINLHLFRLSENSIQNIKKKLFLIALPLIVVAAILIRLFLSYFMKIEFSISIYFFAALSTLPAFLYTVDTMQLMRNKQEKKIMFFSFMVAIINLLLMILLAPQFQILGIVLAVCISQWVYLLLINKNLFPKSFKSSNV